LSGPVSLSVVFGSESSDLSPANPLMSIHSRREVVKPEVFQLSQGIGPTKSVEMTQQQKIAAALLKAGISNPAAWSGAGLGAPSVQVIQEPGPAEGDESDGINSGSGNGFDPHPAVVLTKGTNNKAFLISWRSQLEVARSLGWKSSLMIWGGPALALAGLYLLLNMR
jgi:hypothetical protein